MPVARETSEMLSCPSLDRPNLQTWIFPTNVGKPRDYQYSIVSKALYQNTLVALPTGLGKTFIAATVMLNWFRWTKDAQIVFVAPTKPLVSQQIDACYFIAGIPRSQTTILTGNVAPGIRAEQWISKRVFFMTPQTIVNDLKAGICDPKRIVLLVVDEAHRATGSYAYVEVVKFLQRFNDHFRVLALTATPGSSVESVQEVINGLNISAVEIRTEHSIDIRQYIHQRTTDTVLLENSEEMELVMELFAQAIRPLLAKLLQFNAYWSKDPMQMTAYGLTQARRKWMGSSAGKTASMGVKGMVNRIFSVLASLAHSVDLLKYHGIVPFYHSVRAFRDKATDGKSSKYEDQILKSSPFREMMSTLQSWTRRDDFIGHPKLVYLQSVILNHFLDLKHQSSVDSIQDMTKSGPVLGNAKIQHGHREHTTSRVMIFAHFRDSAEEIVRILKQHSPNVRPHVFVGQAAAKGSDGMDQKKQLETIQQFRSGLYNTLVATSIGEEGLDIGEVDLIVCYDASASPIRMLQRMGRTGRKRAGKITVLLMKGKEDASFAQAKDNYKKMQEMIASGSRFTYHRSQRIIPQDVKPEVDMKIVEIPSENSQSQALPEPKGKTRPPKRPPKKFHMPLNAQMGFQTVSQFHPQASDGKLSMEEVQFKASMPYQVCPSRETVVLHDKLQAELEVCYQVVAYGMDATISAPSIHRPQARLCSLGQIDRVPHGRAARILVDTSRKLLAIDSKKAERFETLLHEDLHSLWVPQQSYHINGLAVDTDKLPSATCSNQSDEELPDIMSAMSAMKGKVGVANYNPSPLRSTACRFGKKRRIVNDSSD